MDTLVSDNLSISYKDHLDQMSIDNENNSSEVEWLNSDEKSIMCQQDTKGKRDLVHGVDLNSRNSL